MYPLSNICSRVTLLPRDVLTTLASHTRARWLWPVFLPCLLYPWLVVRVFPVRKTKKNLANTLLHF